MNDSAASDLGLIATPRELRVLLPADGPAGIELRLPGYLDQLSALLRLCREERVPPHLGSVLPLEPAILESLGEFSAADIHLWADREFQTHFQRLFPGTDLPLRTAAHPPSGTFPINPWSLVRDPVWRLLAELAIPLPRRLVLSVEEPWWALFRSRDTAGDLFSHFLDAGGSPTDLPRPGAPPPHPSLAWGLSRVCSRCLFIAPPVAALIGLQERWVRESPRLPERWFLVHAGRSLATVWALQGGRVRAGLAHHTDRLTPAKLHDYLVQLARGNDLHEEVRLDGGLYAVTRLVPDEAGPWRPVVVTGPRADLIAGLADGPTGGAAGLDWEAAGLRHVLSRRPPGPAVPAAGA
jgi:hypothetical protein